MTKDISKLEEFLNSLTGEVISIFPNVHTGLGEYTIVDFVIIVEKLK